MVLVLADETAIKGRVSHLNSIGDILLLSQREARNFIMSPSTAFVDRNWPFFENCRVVYVCISVQADIAMFASPTLLG